MKLDIVALYLVINTMVHLISTLAFCYLFDASTPRTRVVIATQNADISPIPHTQSSPSPGSMFDFTANIFEVTLAVNPSTCLAYCSTCLEFSSVSNLLGSCGSLKSLCHSSSGSGACFVAARCAFSALRFCCHAVIFVCSRANERW